MDFKKHSIKEVHNMLINKEITLEQLIKETIENAKKHLDSNFLITLCEKEALSRVKEIEGNIQDDNLLWGIPYANKDNFATKGILTTAGSKILANYISPFDATVTKTLIDCNSILLGKTELDELGMGGTGLFGLKGEIRNPYDQNRIIGGSSSGSAYAVAKGIVPFATGTDTGDSVRKPAGLAGIVGFKPTYGSISRYGVSAYAPSLDSVGFLTNSVEDMAIVCENTFQYDPKDFTSIDNKQEILFQLNNLNKKIKFGFIANVEKYMEGKILQDYHNFFKELQKDGHEVIKVDFRKDLLDAIPTIYMMISFAEGVSTNANLDGIKFGIRQEGRDYQEIIRNSRTKGFRDLVKKRFVLGCYQLKSENQELLLAKSKKVRRLIVEELQKVYQEVDILIVPSSLSPAPTIEEVFGENVEEKTDNETTFLGNLLILANFNGMPSITLPFVKEKGLPIGINLNAKPKDDAFLLQVSQYVEKLLKKLDKGCESDE